MPWFALELEVDAREAGPLSDALLELGAQSVAIEDADAATAREAPLYDAPGTEAPGAWPHNRLSVLLAPQADAAALVEHAARSAGLCTAPPYRVTRIDDVDWVRRSQSQFAPLRTGERLWIVPTWCAPPAEEGALVVRLDPGLAFGTGTHPTTALVLAWLERTLRGDGQGAGRAPRRVLDYGCGSGILALAAAKLGASEVNAVDLDPQALEACAANAHANGVALGVAAPEALPPGDYDVIVANILAQPLIELAPLFATRARRGTRLALAGVLAEQSAQVIEAYAPAFDLCVERECEGWALLTGARR